MDEHDWEIVTLILDGWQMMTKYRAIIHDQEVKNWKFDVLWFFLCLGVVYLFEG
jgi:hypothetical protein